MAKPHFFQPLLPGFQHQLSIPVSFYLKHLKGKNAEKAILRSPSGKLWHVKLKERLIEDGWQEFCEEHELKIGHFLVFRFDCPCSNLIFDVLVFDSSSCQKDYPSFFKDEILQTPQQDIPQESSEEILETPQEDIFKESRGQLRNKKKGVTKFEAKAGFTGSKYPHFMMKLSSYAAKCAALYIPIEFARANGLTNRCCKVVLLSEQGKVWIARLGFKQRDGQVYIKQSWSAFRCANSIKAGDSCLFELIRDGEKPVLKITKCPQGWKLNPIPKEEPTNNIALAGSLSKNPRVRVTVHESYDKNNMLRIPSEFAKKSGLIRESPEMMTIQNGKGRSWTVSLRKNTTGGVRIGLGWSTFARSNGIKTGDVLKLELIRKGKNPVMKILGLKRRGAESKKKSSGSGDIKAGATIKQEVDN